MNQGRKFLKSSSILLTPMLVIAVLAVSALSTRAATICIIGDCAGLTFNYAEFAGSTTPIPGGTGAFTSLPTAPSISGGVIAFTGAGVAQLGLYAYPPVPVTPEGFPQGIKVVDLNTLIPDGVGTFTAFPPTPVISGLDVAFVGAGEGGQQGVYLSQGTLVPGVGVSYPPSPVKVADLNTPIPGGVGNFTSFAPLGYMEGSTVLFNGSGVNGQSGLYTFTNGVLSTVISAPAFLPIDAGGAFAFITVLPQFPSVPFRGDVAFIAQGNDFQGVYLSIGSTGEFVNVANTLTTAMPNSTSFFQSFTTASYDGTMIAFAGSAEFGNPVAFQGVYKAVPAAPALPPSPLIPVADTNTVVPGGFGTFLSFGNVVIDPGVVAFEGFSSDGLGGTVHGIYTDMGGTLSKVIATGDVVNGKTVTSLSFGVGGFSDGQVAFAATYSDGSFSVGPATPTTLIQPTITNPAPGAFVRGSSQFSADAPGATAVTFQVDGGAPSPATLASGVSWTLTPPFDTTTLPDGPHTLTAQSVQPLGELYAMSFFISDNTKPAVSIASPTATSYLLNQVVKAAYSCSDVGGSGVASCIGTAPNGSNIDTGSVGAKVFTVNASDIAGNSNSQSVNYNVGYAAGGVCFGDAGHQILQPVNADGTSVFKKGSTVPAKFRVCDASGMSIGSPGVVAGFALVKSATGTVVNNVNETVLSTSADSAFRFDSVAQQWIFNIGTKPLTAGVTYFYRITLNDGSSIDFSFGLK